VRIAIGHPRNEADHPEQLLDPPTDRAFVAIVRRALRGFHGAVVRRRAASAQRARAPMIAVTAPAPLLLALNSSSIHLGFAAGALLGGLVPPSHCASSRSWVTTSTAAPRPDSQREQVPGGPVDERGVQAGGRLVGDHDLG